jgi:hypothetical protein
MAVIYNDIFLRLYAGEGEGVKSDVSVALSVSQNQGLE